MTGHHGCRDGVGGAYKPSRKIEFLKARLAMIADERTAADTPLPDIIRLAALLNPEAPLLLSVSPAFAAAFALAAPALPGAVTLYVPADAAGTRFRPICSPAAAALPENRELLKGRDVLPSWEDETLLDGLCALQEKNELSLIPLPPADMLILKSVTTVQPYDLYLARHYLRQYAEARQRLTPDDRELLRLVKVRGLPALNETYNEAVRLFLKIERKLYLQYGAEEH